MSMTSYLHCTKKVRDFTGIEIEASLGQSAPPPSLGHWYVHMFTVDRRKALLFLSESTLLSFITFGIKKSNASDLRPLFLLGLEQMLRIEEVPDERIEQFIVEYASIRYAKATDRSALGYMNDHVDRYKCAIWGHGGFANCEIGRLILSNNRVPQKKLSWRFPVEALRNVVGGQFPPIRWG